MGIELFSNLTPVAPSRSSTRRPAVDGNGNPLPKAKVWLNIGREVNGKFINLPIGLAIDNMEPAEIRGQNPDWVKQRTAQNALLKALKDLGMSLAPGQEETLQLEVRIRRVNDELQVEPAENEYTIDFSTLMAPAVRELVAAE